MIWFICLFLVVLILVRTAYLLSKRNEKFKSVKVFFYIILSAFLIYFPVFCKELSLAGAVVGDIINTMQMVTLDASFMDSYSVIYESIKISIIANAYILILGLLHILVPVSAIVTAYDCIVNFLSYLRVDIINLKSKDVYVFSDMNNSSIKLALDISEKMNHNVEFVFANCVEDKKIRANLSDKLNYYTVTSDRIDSIYVKLKKSKQAYFFNLSDNSDDNINNTLRLVEKYGNLPMDEQKLIHIYLFSDEKETETIVDSMNKSVLDIKYFDIARVSVYKLFDEYPLYNAINDGCISLLICGMDNIGEETLKAALWLGQLANVKLKINVIDSKAIDKKNELKLNYPEIFCDDYLVNFYQANTNDCSFISILKKYCYDTSYVVVCGENNDENNDENNIGISLYLRRFFLKQNLVAKQFPIIATYISNCEKVDVVKNLKTPELKEEKRISYEIVPFGGANSIYSYDSVMNNPIEKLSINVHLAYEEIFSGTDKIDYMKALQNYNAFEVNKKSNRANAMHIRYKLWMLGLDYTDDQNAEEVDLNEYLNEKTIDELMIAEHDRWMAFLRTEGWETASLEDVEHYKKGGFSNGKHNCSFLKMHPYICPFNELLDRSDALNLPDATKYDKELITMIPLILKNKAITDANYKIIKRGK